MGNIVWLASYPKSGNTWFRVFLTNLLFPSANPASINELRVGLIAGNRELFDEYVGISAAELSVSEISTYRPKAYQLLSNEYEREKELLYMKIHDAYTLNKKQEPIFPHQATKMTLYFIRNPLDVVGSYAHHNHISIDKSIQFMCDNEHTLCENNNHLCSQLEQRLLNWSNHVLSWLESGLPVTVLRYEDMLSDSLSTFMKAINACGLTYSESEVQEALNKCAFSELQKQEKEHGFSERVKQSESFFRQGKAEGWRTELTTNQVEKIVASHEYVMNKFGYLNIL